jgi:hypothetical protein
MSLGAGAMGQIVADDPRGFSLAPPKEIKNITGYTGNILVNCTFEGNIVWKRCVGKKLYIWSLKRAIGALHNNKLRRFQRPVVGVVLGITKSRKLCRTEHGARMGGRNTCRIPTEKS